MPVNRSDSNVEGNNTKEDSGGGGNSQVMNNSANKASLSNSFTNMNHKLHNAAAVSQSFCSTQSKFYKEIFKIQKTSKRMLGRTKKSAAKKKQPSAMRHDIGFERILEEIDGENPGQGSSNSNNSGSCGPRQNR